MTDNDLLNSIACKDEAAFRKFYHKYHNLLYSWAAKRTGNIEQTNEWMQEFWIYLWLNPLKIRTDDQGYCRKFLLSHFTYLMLNYMNREFEGFDKPDTCLTDEVQDELPYSHVEEDLNAQELTATVSKLIRDFPESIREAFTLYWDGDLSIKEIASLQKINERTAYYKVKSGLDIIKKKILKINPAEGQIHTC